LFVVECKGSQTRRASVVVQLRGGVDQFPSVESRGVNKVSLVIAAHMHRTNKAVHGIDPPEDELSNPAPPCRRAMQYQISTDFR
jgi:hypothetical protein